MISTHDAWEIAKESDSDAVRHVIEQLLADRQTLRECMVDDIAMLNSIAQGQVLPESCVYIAGLHAQVLRRIGQ